MISLPIRSHRELRQAAVGSAMLNCWALIILPLLMSFPSVSGWVSGTIVCWGFYVAARFRGLEKMDWQFATICAILPASLLFNMLFMGWVPGPLARPGHLVFGFFIYLVIARYGLRRGVLFWSACAAVSVAFCIAAYEALYLGHARVFGLGHRWNAVPFGNFSLLLSFFCLAGALVAPQDESHPWHRIVAGVAGFGLGLGASVLSGTRGGWVAIPFLLILCLWLGNRISRRRRIAILMALIVSVAAVTTVSPRFQSRFTRASAEVANYLAHPHDAKARSTSTGIRLAMWHWGMDRFLEHPLTGIGFSAYHEQRAEAVTEGELPKEFRRLANLHNELVTRLAMGGLPAAMAVLIFWYLGWQFFTRLLDPDNTNDRHYYAACGLLTVVGTGLFSMTESLFGTSPGTKAIMLLLIIPAGALRYAWRSETAYAEKPQFMHAPTSRSGEPC